MCVMCELVCRLCTEQFTNVCVCWYYFNTLLSVHVLIKEGSSHQILVSGGASVGVGVGVVCVQINLLRMSRACSDMRPGWQHVKRNSTGREGLNR